MRTLILTAAVSLLAVPSVTLSEVPANCRAVFSDAGAVPFTEQCFVLAATASVDLGTYSCTARPEIVTEYCNSLPPYEEDADEVEDDTGVEDGGTGEGGQSGGEGTEDGQDSSGDSDSTGDEEVEFIIGGTSGENEELPAYEEPTGTADGGTGAGTSGGSNGCGTSENPIQGSNGAFDFTVTQGWQFVDGPLGQYSNVASIVALANLANSVDEANETGDTSQVYENIYGIVFPLFPYDSAIGGAFQDFSNFVDQLSGGGC